MTVRGLRFDSVESKGPHREVLTEVPRWHVFLSEEGNTTVLVIPLELEGITSQFVDNSSNHVVSSLLCGVDY